MSEQVAVIAPAMVAGAEPLTHLALQELIFEATHACLGRAKFPLARVESVVLAASDLVDGVGISSMVTATAAGAYLKDEIKVAGDGIFGAILGYLRVASGEFASTLVVSWGKCTQAPMPLVGTLGADPFFQRPVGLNDVTTAALEAGQYLRAFGFDESSGAAVAVKNLAAAMANPHAKRKCAVSAAEVMASRQLAWPLRELTTPAYADGACAVLMVSEALAREIRHPYARVRGVGWATDAYDVSEREPAAWRSLRIAADQARDMARIDRIPGRVHVAEISEITAFHELMAYEALGLCKQGDAPRVLADGMPGPAGRLPVNPSGGLIATSPHPASGLFRFAEAVLQVTGEAGGHQVRDARTALAHGASGMGGQSSGVVIVEGV